MKEWYCYINNETCGPYPEDLLRELINSGHLVVETYVYNDSPEEAPKEWQRAGDTEIVELFPNNMRETLPLSPIQDNSNASKTQKHNKVIIVGILACLLAAQSLIQVLYRAVRASFASGDGEMRGFLINFIGISLVTAMLIISLRSIVLFILSWRGKLDKIAKWKGVILLAGCAFFMFVVLRISITFIGFFVGTFCLCFAKMKQDDRAGKKQKVHRIHKARATIGTKLSAAKVWFKGHLKKLKKTQRKRGNESW